MTTYTDFQRACLRIGVIPTDFEWSIVPTMSDHHRNIYEDGGTESMLHNYYEWLISKLPKPATSVPLPKSPSLTGQLDTIEAKCFKALSEKYQRGDHIRDASGFSATSEAGLTDAECDTLHARVTSWAEPGGVPLTGPWFAGFMLYAYLCAKIQRQGI